MKWSSAISQNPDLAGAVSECADTIGAELDGQRADLAVAFVSAHYASDYEALPELVQRDLGDGLLIGCSGGGIIGAGREVELGPAFAMAAARLPDVDLVPFHIDAEDLPDQDAPPEKWEDLVGISPNPPKDGV